MNWSRNNVSMTRILNAILLAIIVAGIYFLIRDHETLATVCARRDHLAARYGLLEIEDPEKYLVTRIDTGDPAHFLWRCYYPKQINVTERLEIGHNGSSQVIGRSSTVAGEFLHRCRFNFDQSRITVHVMGRRGGGRQQVANGEFAQFLKDHWEELEFDLLGQNGTVEVSTDEVLNFITIRIPQSLLADLKQSGLHRAHVKNLLSRSGVLFEMRYGTQKAFDILKESEKQQTEKAR